MDVPDERQDPGHHGRHWGSIARNGRNPVSSSEMDAEQWTRMVVSPHPGAPALVEAVLCNQFKIYLPGYNRKVQKSLKTYNVNLSNKELDNTKLVFELLLKI